MKYKDIHIFVLLDDFLPQKMDDVAGLLLRDTLNFLEYIKELFETLPDDDDDDIV